MKSYRLTFFATLVFAVASLDTPAQILEREYNDGPGFADPLSGGSAHGAIADASDVDCYELVVTRPSMLSARVSARGASGIDDARLSVLDASGEVVGFDDDGGPGRMPHAVAFLPAGRFFLSVDGPNTLAGGDYALDAALSPRAPTLLRAGSPRSRPIQNPTGDVYRIDLAADTWLTIRVSGAGFPARMTVHAEDGSQLVAESHSGSGARFQGWLQEGTYFARVADATAMQGGTYTITSSEVRNQSDLRLGRRYTGRLTGTGDRLGGRLHLTAAARVDISTGSSSGSSADTVLELYDAAMGLIARNDDESSRSRRSRIVMSLEPGVYFVYVSKRRGPAADVELLAEGSAPARSLPVDFRPTLGTVSANRGAARYTFRLDNRCGVRFSIEAARTPGSRLDLRRAFLSVVDGRGRRVAFDAGHASRDPRVTAELAPGRYTVTVGSGDAGSSGSYRLRVQPPLHVDHGSAPGAEVLRLLAKEGDTAFLLAAAGKTAPTSYAPLAFGVALVDPVSSIALGPVTVAASGVHTWLVLPSIPTAWAQGVVLPRGLLPAVFTNVFGGIRGFGRQGLVLRGNADLEGRLLVDGLTVEPLAQVRITGDTTIDATGKIELHGWFFVSGGASLRVISHDSDIEISGIITSKVASPGRSVTGDGDVIAPLTEAAESGSDLWFLAPRGVVSVTGYGQLVAGLGGIGGSATATGFGSQRAISGPGGDGGTVVISAERIRVAGLVRAGSGGIGGRSKATAGAPEEPTATALSYSARGGRGGNVFLSAWDRLDLQRGAEIFAGDGGASQSATAAGTRADAWTPKGAQGGSVWLRESTTTRVAATVTPGDGGDNGTPRTVHSDAKGTLSGVATVGEGGDHGVYMHVLTPVLQPPVYTKREEGDGGSNGDARAEALAVVLTIHGRSGSKATPAPEITASRP